jgi:FeS assembly SUF system protein
MAITPMDKTALEAEIIEAIRTCYDPEIPVNVYDMGLIYDIKIDREAFVNVKMTLTSPGCPVAGTLPPDVERKVSQVEGVLGARVEVVWDPIWNMEMMSEEARLELGLM